jgi:hypothetical protein
MRRFIGGYGIAVGVCRGCVSGLLSDARAAAEAEGRFRLGLVVPSEVLL